MLEKVVALVDDMAPRTGPNQTFMDNVTLYRAHGTVKKIPLIYDQCMCMMVQGTKIVESADRKYIYGPSNFLVVPNIIPFEGESVSTEEEPLLAVTFSIDFVVLQEVIGQIGKDFFESSVAMAPNPGAYLEPLADSILEPVLRLLQSLKTKGDADILGGQILREIYYRVLLGEQGHILASAAYGENSSAKIARVLRLIHSNYAKPFEVAELASHVNMSTRTFHEHFKAVTSYTPVQYQKRIRLEKARQIIVNQGLQASVTSHMVGYESPSQFSREFKRHFGFPPSEAKANDDIYVVS